MPSNPIRITYRLRVKPGRSKPSRTPIFVILLLFSLALLVSFLVLKGQSYQSSSATSYTVPVHSFITPSFATPTPTFNQPSVNKSTSSNEVKGSLKLYSTTIFCRKEGDCNPPGQNRYDTFCLGPVGQSPGLFNCTRYENGYHIIPSIIASGLYDITAEGLKIYLKVGQVNIVPGLTSLVDCTIYEWSERPSTGTCTAR